MSGLARECHSLVVWAQRSGEGTTVEFVCDEHPTPEVGSGGAVVVRVPGCLADLDPHLPLELLVLGVVAVRLGLDGCARAAVARGRHAGAIAFTAALPGHRRVEEAGRTGLRHTRRVLDARAMPVSRRRALLLLPVARVDLHGLAAEDTTPHQRLLRAMASLLGETGMPTGLLDALAAHEGPGIQLAAAGCVARAVCVRGCPEDALALRAEGWQPGVGESGGGATGVTRLEFRPRRCSGCGACTALCDVDALTIAGAGSWADLLRDDVVAPARIPRGARLPTAGRGGRARGVAAGRRRRQRVIHTPRPAAATLASSMPPACTAAARRRSARNSRTPSTLAVLKVV